MSCPRTSVEAYAAAGEDVKEGRTWYTWEFLKDEAKALKRELEVLGDNEYAEWERAYDAREDFHDHVHVMGMTHPSRYFLPMESSDPLCYVHRVQRYLEWRREIRSFTKATKRFEIDQKVRQCMMWWMNRTGLPGNPRRLEQGLSGLNLHNGAGLGSGGGIPAKP